MKALPHREEEVREALCRGKELLASGVSAGEIVMVARDDAAYGPTVLAVAREYGVPVEALYQVPLTGTRLGSWLGSLLASAEENFPYEQTARILAHPLGRGLSDGQWREVRRRQPRGISGWREAGVELSGSGWPEDWPVSDSRAGWAGRLGGLIEAHRLYDGVLTWVAERTALARLREGIGWIGQAHGVADGADEATLTREEFVDEVREVLRALTVPVHPEGRGVALHTPLSLFGARYRYVFALGMSEGAFPAPVAEDPALDFHERKRLRPRGVRLELAGERARRERLSFWMLLQVPSESLTFSYPKLDGRREALPSLFLPLVGAKEEANSPRPAASVKEARSALLRTGPEKLEDPVLEHAVRSWEVELRREGAGGFDGHDGVTRLPIPCDEREFSVTELRDLTGCGFKWWAGSVLGLSEPEEGEPPTLLGSLLHDTLELAVKRGTEGAGDVEVSLEAPEDLRELILENLEAAFEEAERRLGTERLRAWGIRRKACLEMLRDTVRGEDFVEAGTAAAEVEAKFGGEWRGIRVRGRVDRLDRGPRGVSLVDYKLGGSAPSPNLQLPIYRETAAPALAPGERVQSVYYFSIRNGEKVKAKWPTDGDLEKMAREIRRKLSAGEFPPDAPVRDPQQKACELCGFDAVCRKGARLSRKPLRAPARGE